MLNGLRTHRGELVYWEIGDADEIRLRDKLYDVFLLIRSRTGLSRADSLALIERLSKDEYELRKP